MPHWCRDVCSSVEVWVSGIYDLTNGTRAIMLDDSPDSLFFFCNTPPMKVNAAVKH